MKRNAGNASQTEEEKEITTRQADMQKKIEARAYTGTQTNSMQTIRHT